MVLTWLAQPASASSPPRQRPLLQRTSRPCVTTLRQQAGPLSRYRPRPLREISFLIFVCPIQMRSFVS
ncbi:MAG: hypothetical protein AMS25_18170, partial [Gemmatimonas sp. SM23_52]